MGFTPIFQHRSTRSILAVLLLAFAVAGRLLPHPANFTPLYAATLFAATVLGSGYALLIAVAAMAITDPILGLYEPPVMAAVYGCLLLVAGLGRACRGRGWGSVAGATLLGSTVFFLVTNAAVAWFTPYYARTLDGLLTSYAMALPFWRNTLLGDFLYTGMLFGAYAAVVALRSMKYGVGSRGIVKI